MNISSFIYVWKLNEFFGCCCYCHLIENVCKDREIKKAKTSIKTKNVT
jgi:hypothetical protein